MRDPKERLRDILEAISAIERYLHRTVILEREEDGGYHAFCPALKGCHTQGDTLDEILTNIKEAIEAYLKGLKAHGELLPVEGRTTFTSGVRSAQHPFR